jgi:hypothetical protein
VDDLIKVMEAINLIAGFLSWRDIDRLSKDALKKIRNIKGRFVNPLPTKLFVL